MNLTAFQSSSRSYVTIVPTHAINPNRNPAQYRIRSLHVHTIGADGTSTSSDRLTGSLVSTRGGRPDAVEVDPPLPDFEGLFRTVEDFFPLDRVDTIVCVCMYVK